MEHAPDERVSAPLRDPQIAECLELASVAERTVYTASCAVLTVPPQDD